MLLLEFPPLVGWLSEAFPNQIINRYFYFSAMFYSLRAFFFSVFLFSCGSILQAQLPWGKKFYVTAYSQKFTKEGQEGRDVTFSLFKHPVDNTVTFADNLITIKLDGFIIDMLKVTDIQETDKQTMGLCVSLKYKFEYTFCLFEGGKAKDGTVLWNFDIYTPVLLDRYQLTDRRSVAKSLE